MDGGIEVRIFFGSKAAGALEIEGSHARRFPVVPTVGQTVVFGRPTGAIAVWRVAETGFFAWDEGTSLWVRVEAVAGEHRAPAGYYDPMAKLF